MPSPTTSSAPRRRPSGSLEAVLEAFGEYWTVYTIEEGYGDLCMMGGSLNEFLDNLDSMHDRIEHAMPGLVPPSFKRDRLRMAQACSTTIPSGQASRRWWSDLSRPRERLTPRSRSNCSTPAYPATGSF